MSGKKKGAGPPKSRSATEIDKIIGLRLRTLRMEKQMGQDELGKALGISFQQVQKYEKGVNRIGSSRLIQIATVLETETDYFLGDMVKASKRTNGENEHAQFMATREGQQIVRAMIELKPAMRQSIIDLARSLAQAS